MILESLTVRNWRGYREAHRYDFAEGLNLLVGPNESGKSTLFEALARALFDRHGSRAAEVRRIQPLGSTLGPEVMVVLRSGGCRLRVRKRFLIEPLSELLSERAGGFELDHEGDAADETLRRLLGGERSRGPTRAEHRGLAQALWCLQREAAIPERAWSHALEHGLSGLVEVTLRTPAEDSLLSALEREYATYFTASGRVSRTSELGALERELPELERELERRGHELERAAAYRQQLEELQVQAFEIGRRRAAEAERVAHHEREVEAGREVELRKQRLEHELEGQDEGLRALRRTVYSIERRQRRIGELERSLESSSQGEARLAGDVRQFRRAAEAHARRWERDLKPRLDTLEATLAELRSRLRVEQLEREAQLLTSLVTQRRALAERRVELLRNRDALRAPDPVRFRELRAAASNLEVAQARLRSEAVRVSFELEPPYAALPDPVAPRDPETAEFLLTRPTTFELSGVAAGDASDARRVRLGQVSVRHSGDGLEALEREAARLSERLREACASHDAGDIEELEQRLERRRELDAELLSLDARIAEHGRSRPSTEDRLLELEAELAVLRRRSPQPVLPGIEGWARARTSGELRELEEERARLVGQLGEEREAEQAAQQECLNKSEELREVSQQAAASRSEITSLRDGLAHDLATYGSADALGALVGRRERELEELREAQRRVRSEFQERLELPRERLREARARLEALRLESERLQSEVADRLGRLEEVAALGLYSQIGDLEARRDRLRDRRAVLERRSEAVRLLYDLLGALRRERSSALAAPVSALVDRWLERLTAGGHLALSLDHRLLPVGVESGRHGELLPLESLSWGTHEQVAILLRLAMAVLLAEEERQLVVVDDRLVNADPERMERLCAILEEVGERCQLLVATCRPELYSALHSARRIEVPAPALPSFEPRGVAALAPPEAR